MLGEIKQKSIPTIKQTVDLWFKTIRKTVRYRIQLYTRIYQLADAQAGEMPHGIPSDVSSEADALTHLGNWHLRSNAQFCTARLELWPGGWILRSEAHRPTFSILSPVLKMIHISALYWLRIWDWVCKIIGKTYLVTWRWEFLTITLPDQLSNVNIYFS